jgi:hypothetical protein
LTLREADEADALIRQWKDRWVTTQRKHIHSLAIPVYQPGQVSAVLETEAGGSNTTPALPLALPGLDAAGKFQLIFVVYVTTTMPKLSLRMKLLPGEAADGCPFSSETTTGNNRETDR